jgi:thioredoxin 1
MATVELTQTNFEQVALKEGIVLIECWSAWCQTCKTFSPVFEAAAERHPEHTFATIDTRAERELSEKLGVSHVPTLILFRDGILLFREPGVAPAEALDEIVDKAEGLDMDHVRSELEPESAASQ